MEDALIFYNIFSHLLRDKSRNVCLKLILLVSVASLTLDICSDVYKAGEQDTIKPGYSQRDILKHQSLEVYSTEILGFSCNGKYFTTSSLTVGYKTTMISLGIFVVLNS